MKIKKGNQVKIVTGKDKGKTGEVLEINKKLNLLKVKAINLVKKHQKPTKENKGGIISKRKFCTLFERKKFRNKKRKALKNNDT